MPSTTPGSNDLVLKSITDPSNQQLITISSDSHQLTGQRLVGGEVMTVFAAINRDGQGARIECPTEGLQVNQQPTQSALLNKGDVIQIGYASYSVVETGAATRGSAPQSQMFGSSSNARPALQPEFPNPGSGLATTNPVDSPTAAFEAKPIQTSATTPATDHLAADRGATLKSHHADSAVAPQDARPLNPQVTTEGLDVADVDVPAQGPLANSIDSPDSSVSSLSSEPATDSIIDALRQPLTAEQPLVEEPLFEQSPVGQVPNEQPSQKPSMLNPQTDLQPFENPIAEQPVFQQQPPKQSSDPVAPGFSVASFQEEPRVQPAATPVASNAELRVQTSTVPANQNGNSPEESLEKLLAALKSVDVNTDEVETELNSHAGHDANPNIASESPTADAPTAAPSFPTAAPVSTQNQMFSDVLSSEAPEDNQWAATDSSGLNNPEASQVAEHAYSTAQPSELTNPEQVGAGDSQNEIELAAAKYLRQLQGQAEEFERPVPAQQPASPFEQRPFEQPGLEHQLGQTELPASQPEQSTGPFEPNQLAQRQVEQAPVEQPSQYGISDNQFGQPADQQKVSQFEKTGFVDQPAQSSSSLGHFEQGGPGKIPELPPAANRPDLQAPDYLNPSYSTAAASHPVEPTIPSTQAEFPVDTPTDQLPGNALPTNEDVAKLFSSLTRQSAEPESPVAPSPVDQSAELSRLMEQVSGGSQATEPTDAAEMPATDFQAAQPGPLQGESAVEQSLSAIQNAIASANDEQGVDDAVNSWRHALAAGPESEISPVGSMELSLPPLQESSPFSGTESSAERPSEAMGGAHNQPASTEPASFSQQNVPAAGEFSGGDPESPSAPEGSESEDNSVAAVLARMQMNPQLESVEVEPEAPQSFQESSIAEADVAPLQPQEEPTPESEQGSADVQSYMNSLLQRLNGSEGSAASAGTQEKAFDALAEPEMPAVPSEPLSADEFIPKHMAPEVNSNMSAMRELANMATKNALVNSEYKKSRTTRTWLLTSAISGLLGATFFWLLSHSAADPFSIIAMFCLGASVVTGSLFAYTQRKAATAGS